MMKNIFAITFGTSDVQFNQDVVGRHGFIIAQNGNIFVLKHREKNIEISLRPNRDRQNYYLLSSPRIDGEKVYNHIADFLPVIELPLTLPVIKQIRKTDPELIIDCWFLVDTNQDKEKVKEQHWKNDTLFVSRIFKAKLQYVFPDEKDEKFKFHTITEELTNIDKQYLDFRRKCPYIFDLKEEEINQIFLLPQGGIDQINQALTLQLIQAYKTKVKQWQQAEDKEPKELFFVQNFLNDLNKQKIIKHLEDYDFGLIANSGFFSSADEIFKLSEFAHSKLNLDYENLDKNCNYYEDDIPENKAKDLYLHAKIYYKRGDFGNYLWRLFTLIENLYRIEVDKVFGNTENLFNEIRNNPNDNQWIKMIKKFEGLEDFLETRKMNNKKNIEWKTPNKFAYKYIFNFLIDKGFYQIDQKRKDNLNFIFNKCMPLLSKRNDIAHYLRPVTKEIIESSLPQKVTLDTLNQKWDEIFNISKEKPFGVYDDIKDDIKNILNLW